MSHMPKLPTDEQVEKVRSFNRFYTRHIGLLNEGLLDSVFSLTEARVLYELAHRDSVTAADLGRDLGLDAGYLSRLLKRFGAQGLIHRSPSKDDRRQFLLSLSDKGRAAFEVLNHASATQVSAMLSGLSAGARERLVQAMTTVENLVGDGAKPDLPCILRPHQLGDIGWIAHRQGLLYAQEYGWDQTFEALVAEIAAVPRGLHPRDGRQYRGAFGLRAGRPCGRGESDECQKSEKRMPHALDLLRVNVARR